MHVTMPSYSVHNATRQAQVASDVELANTYWTRLKGLLGKSAAEFTIGKGLWISPCQGIHTIGMSFPIDAAYLDSAGRVLRVYRSLAPFRLTIPGFRAHSVLELPEGTLLHSGTQPGDLLQFTPAAKENGSIKKPSTSTSASPTTFSRK
jgi:uncharacterized membrane protein (UPF0127 family)